MDKIVLNDSYGVWTFIARVFWVLGIGDSFLAMARAIRRKIV